MSTNSNVVAVGDHKSLTVTEDPPAIRSFERSIERWMGMPIMMLDQLTDADRQMIKQVYEIECDRLRGGSPKQIGAQLAMVRHVLNVEGPDEQASRVYLRLLAGVPADLLGLMTKNLLSTYRFNSFPKPADFLAAVEEATKERSRRKHMAAIMQTRLAVHDLYYGRKGS